MFKPLFVKSYRGSLWFAKILAIGLMIIVIATILGYFLMHHYSSFAEIHQSFTKNAGWFFLFRLVLIALIVFAWPYYIKALSKRARNQFESKLSEEEKDSRKWISSRWLILALLLGVEAAMNFDRIVNFF